MLTAAEIHECPECAAHFNECLDDPRFHTAAIRESLRSGNKVKYVMAQYIITHHLLGHPSDEDALAIHRKEQVAPWN